VGISSYDDQRDRDHGTRRRDRLIAWTREVFAEAGLGPPTPEQEDEILRSIAGWLLTQRIEQFAESKGAPQVDGGDTLFVHWLKMTEVGAPNVIARWDEICGLLTVMLADERVDRDDPGRGAVESELGRELDEVIESELLDLRAEYVEGVRGEFGPAAVGAAPGTGSATGGGCMLASLTVLAAAGIAAVALVCRSRG
jgi:hypothetical protein